MSEEALATVAIVYSQPEAAVLLSLLRGHGFVAFAHHQGTIGALPNYLLALGGIRICVASSEVGDALELLSDCDQGWSRPPPAYTSEPISNLLLGLLLLGMGGFAPPPRAPGSYAWAARPRAGEQ